MSYEKDYYAILQVSRNASQEEIERAFTRLSQTYHPETSQKKRAAQRFADVQAAYETLKDPRKRRQYDRQVAAERAAAGGMAPGDVLSNRFVLLSGGVIVASIGVIIALVLLLGGGGGSDEVAANTGTPTPAGQTPGPTVPASPPDITAPFTTTPSGLQIATIQEGTGPVPVAGETVSVNYTGWLSKDQGGGVFDSSLKPGRAPFNFVLGQGKVIKAWDEGVAMMKVGGVYRIIAPPDLAYGANGSGGVIPPNATLTFDIAVLSIGTPTPVASAGTASASATPTAVPAGTTAPADTGAAPTDTIAPTPTP